MKVYEVMSIDVATCRRRTNLAEAVALMWERDCGALPVLDDEGTQVIGLLTDRDIAVAVGTRGQLAAQLAAEEAMSQQPQHCRDTDELAQALGRMSERKIRRLPVLNASDQLCGMLSIDDVIAAVGKIGKRAAGPTTAELLRAVQALSYSHLTDEPRLATNSRA